MLFPTFVFATFFLIVLPVGWLLHSRPTAWKVFMLAASYVFYGWWDVRFVALIVASTIGNQILADLVHRSAGRTRSRIVTVGVAFNLVTLGFFKYAGFFVDSANDTLESLGVGGDLPLLSIVLPVGISFFTFQALSYVLDVHRGTIEPARPLDFAVYLAFFPQLVAGPIVRASEFLPQLEKRLNPRDIDLTRALVLIGAGLFKKVVIASYLADAIVDDVFAFPERFSSLEVLVGVYAYAIQIYADFSGYTDIAIGIALLLGFRFPPNFDRPYQAVSIRDFWRRWHMTLSRWLRDYLYISLGGNRGGAHRRDRNLLLTMVLGGLWHGAAWTFVIWGALHGFYMIAERHAEKARMALGDRRPGGSDHGGDSGGAVRTVAETRADGIVAPGLRTRILGRIRTFHLVCLGWIFFRAGSFDAALNVIERLFVAWGDASPAVTGILVWTIAASLAAQYLPRVGLTNLQSDLSRLPVWVQAVGFALWLLVIDRLGPEGVAPFIYFQF
ncbi:MAG: MBOAT family protein [Acidimicrobiales bacterium]